ncbi:MAG: hypothetical protein HKN99_02105 [Winogradskyella sp.]|nr:hypothetical protein [Winogradskyella sp.]MBT8375575.1 hypothetical protein [Bacteroidia bacterium]NNC44656.1 hypothetical protein [Winogradskyella sp.]NNF85001.1 hypothetical protein [Winogradskyella sp.]NNL82993.1 hypothetical protein [Winogradskyella sp.]
MLMGSVIAILVAATPFLFYVYEYVPHTKIWETPFFTYESNFYEDAYVGIWVLMMKIVPLLLSLLWFFTCRHWWYHALLVPIAMFAFQILSALNDDNRFMDEFHIVWLLPVMAIVIPSIYLLRARMFNRINDADKTMEELEEEFKIKPKTFMDKVKQYF